MTTMDERECFAYKRGKCSALNIKKCQGSSCPFMKTKAQLEKERREAFKHIQSLDPYMRETIIDTYYKGKEQVLEDKVLI